MRKQTAQAINDWRAHAAATREANKSDPNAFTVPDYAAEANVGIDRARKIVREGVAAGTFKPAKKMVNGRLRDAFVMVTK